MAGSNSRTIFSPLLFKLIKIKPIANLASKFFNSYGQIWDTLAITEKSAIESIYFGVKNESEFDLVGKKDADMLRRLITPNDVILDIGCGVGRIEKYLATDCKEIYGTDVSRRMLKFARKRLDGLGNVKLYRGNGRDLAVFMDGKFDFVFSMFLLQHLEKEDAVYYLLEAHRVLKTGGTLFFNVPNFLADENFKVTFIDKYVKNPSSRTAIRMRYYLPDEVKKIVTAIGFKIISLKIDTDIQILVRKPLWVKS